jgi:cell division transport system permease protein
MKINTFKYFVGDAFKSIKRNRTLSIASIATVAATFFILGVFLLTIMTVKNGIGDVQSKIQVQVFLNDDIKASEQKDLETKIKNTDGVVDVKYETKEQAFEKFKEQLGEDNKNLIVGLDKESFLPASYIIKVTKPEKVTNVVNNIKSMTGIEKINDGRAFVDKVITISNALKWIGFVIFVVLIGVSLFLIGNTIKITVYSRKREISIMKFIGATDWFIRWPFVLEGMIIGTVGVLIADAFLYFTYKMLYVRIVQEFIISNLVSPNYVSTIMLWQFLLGGIVIGALGSITSIRRFLAV